MLSDNFSSQKGQQADVPLREKPNPATSQHPNPSTLAYPPPPASFIPRTALLPPPAAARPAPPRPARPPTAAAAAAPAPPAAPWPHRTAPHRTAPPGAFFPKKPFCRCSDSAAEEWQPRLRMVTTPRSSPPFARGQTYLIMIERRSERALQILEVI